MFRVKIQVPKELDPAHRASQDRRPRRRLREGRRHGHGPQRLQNRLPGAIRHASAWEIAVGAAFTLPIGDRHCHVSHEPMVVTSQERHPPLRQESGPRRHLARHPAGLMVGIVGPDGVGKSTLVGADRRRRRRCRREHRPRRRHRRCPAPRAPCPRIAYMPQGLGKNLYLELSVRRQRRLHGAALRAVAARSASGASTQLLEATGLGPFPDRPAGKLSGGMKQKVGLCCGAGPRSRPAHPRRAHHRRRSALPPAVLDAHRRHPRRPAGHERASSPPPTWTRRSGGTGSWPWTRARCWRPARRRS